MNTKEKEIFRNDKNDPNFSVSFFLVLLCALCDLCGKKFLTLEVR